MKKMRLLKRPIGGPTVVGPTTKTVSSGDAWTNNNQGVGSYKTMESILADPYQFSFDTGATKLPRNTWSKLNPAQQQTIWREGLTRMGFVQIGENSFDGTNASFGWGGAIGTAGGALLAAGVMAATGGIAAPLIPGILSTGASIGNSIGNNIDQEMQQKKSVSSESQAPVTANPFGFMLGGKIRYKNGGKLVPTYEVEDEEIVIGPDVFLQGTKSGHSSSVGKVASGKIHKYGGVDGIGGNFVISDRLTPEGKMVKPGSKDSLAARTKPFMKALASLEKKNISDPLVARTHKAMKERVEKNAEVNMNILRTRESRKKKFALGGPQYGLTDSFSSMLSSAVSPYLANGPKNIDPSLMLPEESGFANPGFLNSKLKDENTGEYTKDQNFMFNADYSIKEVFPRTSSIPGIKAPLVSTRNLPQSKVNVIGIDTETQPEFPGIKMPRTTVAANESSVANKMFRDSEFELDKLTKAGRAVSLGSAALQSGLTLTEYFLNKKKNPNVNFFQDVSSRSEGMLEDSITDLRTGKGEAIKNVRRVYNPAFSSQMSNSLNVDRVIKGSAYSNMANTIGQTGAQYDALISEAKGRKAQVALQGDTYEAEGNMKVREADQQDLANLFTSLGFNTSDITNQYLNSVKVVQGAKNDYQAVAMLKRMYPNMTLQQVNDMYEIIVRNGQ